MNVNDEFDPELPPLSAEEEARVQSALAELGRDAAGPARDEFRAQLRARFVAGTIEAPLASAAEPVDAPRVPVAARRPRVLRPWAAALAAAALLAIVVFAWMPRPETPHVPAWTVIAVTGDSVGVPDRAVRIGNRDVALAALPATVIAAGERVELPTGVAMELRLEGTLALETAPGTAFTVPTVGTARRASVEHGELRFATGPAFAGTRLTVASPEAMVEVTGTAFVVIAAPQMTCVCVGEGSVHVTARAGADSAGTPAAAFDIAAGHRREIYPDGTMSGELVVHAHEAAMLGRLKAGMTDPAR